MFNLSVAQPLLPSSATPQIHAIDDLCKPSTKASAEEEESKDDYAATTVQPCERTRAILPKPLGTMTYAEMSAEIARLYFKNSALSAEVQRLKDHNLDLRIKEKKWTLILTQHAEYYENRLSGLYTELHRVREFAGSFVNTI